MSSIILILFLKLNLIMFVSGQSATGEKNRSEKHFSASKAQKKHLAETVCTDLEWYLQSEEALKKCKENYRWDLGPNRSGLQLFRRSDLSITFEVAPTHHYQLIVLIPDPNDNNPYSLLYCIIQPDTKFGEVTMTPGTNYTSYFTILNKHGRPTKWHKDSKIIMETPPPKKYDEQVAVSSTYIPTNVWENKDGNNATLPETPEDVSIEAEEYGDFWKVNVSWSKPRVTPDTYKVILRTDKNFTRVVPGISSTAMFYNVTGTGLYNVSVYALIGIEGVHTSRRAILPTRRYVVWRWAAAAGGAWGAVGVGAIAAMICWLRIRRRILRPIHFHEGFKIKEPVDESKSGSDVVESRAADVWELRSERLLLHEVIGEGAFGVVRRGTLAPNGKEVAVKMLKDYPSLDEMRSFRLEMELMKSVGAHPHVLSLVGCCSGTHPLIIVEYCAQGDLLSFLRRSWDVMISKRKTIYYNNNIDTSNYRNDLFKCKRPQEHSRLVINKIYDLQGNCESDLTPLDLLSFCRQIAMGMEFLASDRVVHRDLAARNILVTGDRTLKIADFGLSRDVYEENQYKQKGNGKMPVKWMALESLTRRIYTTQSDVWSFGVVMWEVLTVGGSPYPEIAAARLPRLLRAGYRMPRPLNCSEELYDVMLSCWDASPRERPTFAELHAQLDELLNSECADRYVSLELNDEPPPSPKPHKYFSMIFKAKRTWMRSGSYERPLKALYNHYTSTPPNKSPV